MLPLPAHVAPFCACCRRSLAKEQARTGDDSGLRAIFSVYDKDASGTVYARLPVGGETSFASCSMSIARAWIIETYGCALPTHLRLLAAYGCALPTHLRLLPSRSDSREFAKICDDIGFGSAASQIFRDLDKDGNGVINYHELLGLLTKPAEAAGKRDGRSSPGSPSDEGGSTQTKLFLMAAAWHEHAEDSAKDIFKGLDTSGWVYDTAHGPTGLAKSIRANLKSTGRPVADLIELFNFTEKESGNKADGKGAHGGGGTKGGASRTDVDYFQVDRAEFVRAFKTRLNYQGGEDLLREIFKTLDKNHDGVVDQGEVFEFIAGRALLLQRAEPEDMEKLVKTLHLKPAFPKARQQWSSDELRAELQNCLTQKHVAPHWLIEQWDEE